jgi:hypothetical protein
MCDFVVVRVAAEEAEEAGDPGVAGGAAACGNQLAPGDANADADPEDARAALAAFFPGAGSSGDSGESGDLGAGRSRGDSD